MPITRSQATIQHAPTAGVLLIALLATWFAYSPGISGTFYFDDPGNLGGLAFINDRSSALTYILSGTAGPLGRPLALATFVPEASAWPHAPEVFLRTNILIHLLNGVLVIWLLYLLGISRHQAEQQAGMVATGAGAIWMLMPVLASSSLFVVQRMTTLSAAFLLLGAIAYLYSRLAIERRPVLALCGMTLALGAGVLLSSLAKENGVLLFVFVLAIEAFLLRRPSSTSPAVWRSWLFVVLVIPSVILFAYLATRIPYPDAVVLRRDFNGFERLLTQAGILWKYLYFAFVPSLPSLGPFHDDYAIKRSLLDPTALIPMLAWLVVIVTAVVLRRKAPVFGFAVAWYLLGHSLESTTVLLELYFEHRNYVPLVGPAYALVSCASHVATQWRRLMFVVIGAYCVVLAGVLYSVTSLWGNPAIAAEMWYIYKPSSIRAADKLAYQMELVGDPIIARRTYMESREKHPEAHYLDLRILLISCQVEPDKDYDDAMQALEDKLRTSRFSYNAVDMLLTAYTLVRDNKCPGVSRSNVYRFAESILANPRFDLPGAGQLINMIQAQIAVDNQNLSLAKSHVETALELNPDLGTIALAVDMFNRIGSHDAADEIIAKARARSLRGTLRTRLWNEELDRLERDQSRLFEANQPKPTTND